MTNCFGGGALGEKLGKLVQVCHDFAMFFRKSCLPVAFHGQHLTLRSCSCGPPEAKLPGNVGTKFGWSWSSSRVSKYDESSTALQMPWSSLSRVPGVACISAPKWGSICRMCESCRVLREKECARTRNRFDLGLYSKIFKAILNNFAFMRSLHLHYITQWFTDFMAHNICSLLALLCLRQRALRVAHRFRVQVKFCVYSPTLWELETQLLGEKLKAHLPKDYTKQKIQQHRQAWEAWGMFFCKKSGSWCFFLEVFWNSCRCYILLHGIVRKA